MSADKSSDSFSDLEKAVATVTHQISQSSCDLSDKNGKIQEDKDSDPFQDNMERDLERVFGPGAVALAKQYQEQEEGSVCLEKTQDEDGMSKSLSDSGEMRSSSTPRTHSRGRTRLRNSGRSSTSSPSPVRPRLDSDLVDPGGGVSGEGVDKGTKVVAEGLNVEALDQSISGRK